MPRQTTVLSQLVAGGPGGLACFLLLAASATPAIADEKAASASGQEVDFESQVYPIFEQRCQVCHGSVQQLGELRLDSKAVALRGGVSGPNIVPGDADQSPMFQRIAGIGTLNAMPLTGERLSEDDIALIKHWIDQGASWPDAVGVATEQVALHWAYQPAVRHAPPAVRQSDAVRNPATASSLPAGEGGPVFERRLPETLVRRVSLDLRGLPPTIEEVDRFVGDTSPDAYERLIDRMLKSPHYGEHWAGYWLDLARYADTNGYESDEPRTIWAYRDWVIDAFNRNLPFDRFTIEQLAGDLLPNPTVDQIVATGFHRNTMLNNEAGAKNDEFYDAAVKDRVDTTATVWLGSTVGCAQCHDHKYDPFKQTEYYKLYAIFNNTADSAIKISSEMDVFTGENEELGRRTAEVETVKAVLDTQTAVLDDSQRVWEARIVPDLAPWQDAWQVLQPTGAAVVDGADLQVLSDGSVLGGEPAGSRGVYELTFEPESTTLTGLRIETLPHESLTTSRPGQEGGRAFSLTGIEAEAWTPSRQNDARAALTTSRYGTNGTPSPFRVRSRDEAFRTVFPPENRDRARGDVRRGTSPGTRRRHGPTVVSTTWLHTDDSDRTAPAMCTVRSRSPSQHPFWCRWAASRA